ncbi:CHAT domain-containing protein [Lentzea flaviverrucosa]|uniref:CHAT domain-containing protein n=1 Tax=Lentzea flaviverrucosa TaxID=200379 RepID=A0A1H9CB15_9PSEU|nr:CHAT domain-containing protein [Lentzea flaviverrucosa]RDI24498.1 CHAT domain-containing protein [Lentzea flaviverrucosa]SEP98376.1 CHAT domain-containing protein [Lentzea flaviverrucosa]
MVLPRVFIDLVPRYEKMDEQDRKAGWTVTVSGPGIAAQYELDRREVSCDGVVRGVPARRGGMPADDLGDLLSRLATKSCLDGEVQHYGRWLFDCLLGLETWASVRQALDVVAVKGVELALRWPPDEAELHQLSWEAMHDGRNALAGHPDLLVAISRVVPAGPDEPPSITRPPKVLFAVGGSLDEDTIRPGAMFMGLLKAFEMDGYCSSKAVQGVTIDSLAWHCKQFQPDIVHIVAHGEVVDGEGLLQLADRDPVGVDSLMPALTAGGAPLAVVLSACQSGGPGLTGGKLVDASPLAAELVARGIPIVSAVAGAVSEPACRLYTKQLVEAVYRGVPVVEAAAKGRRAALQQSGSSSTQLDWAMPALFVGEELSSSFRPVDAAAAGRLVDIAKRLRLSEPPVFIGRNAIMGLLDDLFEYESSSSRLGTIAAVRDASIKGLGGTRLLREIGFQLLLRGHLPVLLGPFDTEPPAGLRDVVVEILLALEDLARQFDVSLTSLRTLSADPRFEPCGEVSEEALAALTPEDRGDRVLDNLAAFRESAGSLDPVRTKSRLAADLDAFAEVMSTAGDPFSKDTRVVVLADEVHRWGALEPLLQILGRTGRDGLGTAKRPAPVIFTASSREHDGARVKAFSESYDGKPGYAFPELDVLTIKEAVVGFQWVLLHPWKKNKPEYRQVYAAKADVSSEVLDAMFHLLGGRPVAVKRELYDLANALRVNETFVANDDEQAWDNYLRLHP